MTADRTPSFPRLAGDIGGTNARFALQEAPGAAPTQVVTYRVEDHATFGDAIKAYLGQLPAGLRPRQGAIGIANPVVGDHVQMTNSHWAFSIEAVRREVGFERFLVVNDFTALALSLPGLEAEHVRQVGEGVADPLSAVGLVGAGTGLGVSGLLRVPGSAHWVPLGGEGGHVSLAPATAREDAVVAALRARFGHASAERALSGQGLVNLYEALCDLDRVVAAALDPAGVTTAALAGSDAHCVEAVELFFARLGSVAGNLALTLGARGGMYIGGGIVPRLGDWIDRSTFRERFLAKGRMRERLLAGIPTFVIHAETSPALIGAARALDEL